MAQLRWWAEKTGRQNVIARSNDAYGIPERIYVTNVSKAAELDEKSLERVTDPYTVLPLRLQAAFGLRRKESIKFQPAWADRGDRIVLKSSWAEGSRAGNPLTQPRSRPSRSASIAKRGSSSAANLDSP